MNRFEVVHPGLLTTYQDLGRPEMLKYALSASGAMDQSAARLVNLLLHNSEESAVLETTMAGLTLRALNDGLIVVGGADLNFMINAMPAEMWTVLKIRAGDIVSFEKQKTGVRAYLGVFGGFDSPVILGSRSVYLRGALGRALKIGDEICSLAAKGRKPQQGKHLPLKYIPDMSTENPFRVLPGPQIDHFTENGIHTFSHSTYSISLVSDRQGIRTEGPEIEKSKGPDIITDPTPMGSIQVPGSGVPIILHRDAQVTGGYAKIALLCVADQDRAGQLVPFDKIHFKFIDRSEALQLLKNKNQWLQEIKDYLEKGNRFGNPLHSVTHFIRSRGSS